MPVSKAHQRATNKYNKAHYDRINLSIPKGEKEIIKAKAIKKGESTNEYIRTAIRKRIETDE